MNGLAEYIETLKQLNEGVELIKSDSESTNWKGWISEARYFGDVVENSIGVKMSAGEVMIRGNFFESTVPQNVSGGKLYIDFQDRKPNESGNIFETGQVVIPSNTQTLSA